MPVYDNSLDSNIQDLPAFGGLENEFETAESPFGDIETKRQNLLANAEAKRTKQIDTTVTGLYDADSPTLANPVGKPTARLTGDGYYVNSPELKDKAGNLTQEGINARIQADNFAMGVEAPNFPEGEGLDPQYYKQYTDAINPAIVDRQEAGQYVVTPTGKQGRYGRELVQATSEGVEGSQTDYLLDKGQGVKRYIGREDKLKALTQGLSETVKEGRLGEAVDALQYGLGRKAAGIGDWIVDAAYRGGKDIYKGFTGATEEEANKEFSETIKGTVLEPFMSEDGKDFVGLDDYKEAVEYGYDDHRTKKVLNEVGEAWDKKDWLGLGGAIMEGIFTAGPEFALESSGEIISGAFGKVGLALNVGDYTNQILEEREKITGEVADAEGRLIALAAGTGMGLINKIGTDEIIGRSKIVTDSLKAIAATGSRDLTVSAAREIAGKIGRVGATGLGKGVYEGGEEISQEILNIVGEKFGTEAQDEILSDASGKRLAQGFAGGLTAGTTLGTVSSLSQESGLTASVEQRAQTQAQREAFNRVVQIEDEVVTNPSVESFRDAATRIQAEATGVNKTIAERDSYNELVAKTYDLADTDEKLANIHSLMIQLHNDPDVDYDVNNQHRDWLKNVKSRIQKVVDNESKRTADDIAAEAEGIGVTGEISNETVQNIEELKATIKQITSMDKSEIKGSDVYIKDDINKEADELQKIMEDYLNGKDIEVVGKEFAEVGLSEFNSSGKKVKGSKRGVRKWGRELSDALNNPARRENLQKRAVELSEEATFKGLSKFMESRKRKLHQDEYGPATQTNVLLQTITDENSYADGIIENLIKQVETTDISDDLKSSYKTELEAMRKNLTASDRVVAERQKLVKEAQKLSPETKGLAYTEFQDGTVAITKWSGKDSTPVRVFEITDGKLVAAKAAPKSTITPKVKKAVKSYIDGAIKAGTSFKQIQAKIDTTKNVSAEDRANAVEYARSVYPTTEEKAPDIKTTEAEAQEAPVAKVSEPGFEGTSEFAEAKETLGDPVKETPIAEIAEKPSSTEDVKPTEAKAEGKVKEGTKRAFKEAIQEMSYKAFQLDEDFGRELNKLVEDGLGAKKAVIAYKNKVKAEFEKENTVLKGLISRYESYIEDQRSQATTRSSLGKAYQRIVEALGRLLKVVADATTKLKGVKASFTETNKALNEMLKTFKKFEQIADKQLGEDNTVTTENVLGEIKESKDSIYGMAVVSIGDTTVAAIQGVKRAIEEATAARKAELGGTLAGGLIENFVGSYAKKVEGRMFKKTKDSVFGTKSKNIFTEDPQVILESLPASFTDFFAKDKAGKEALTKDLEVMKKFTTAFSVPSNLAYDGEVGVTRDEALVWDRKVSVQESPKNVRRHLSSITNKAIRVKLTETYNKNGIEVLQKEAEEYTSPEVQKFLVKITAGSNFRNALHVILGNDNGKATMPPQMETMVKFYAAKMLSDINTLASEIASKDDLELAKMGISGEVDQEVARTKALNGEVPISSVRADIGKAMYKALGIKLRDNVPEVTRESLISGLSLLVQKTVEETGLVTTDLSEDGAIKYAKVDWAKVESFLGKEGKRDLSQSVNKLQYINESRSRQMVTKKPLVDEDAKLIMNSTQVMSEDAKDFINTQQEIPYNFNKKLTKWIKMAEKDPKGVLKAFGWKDTNDSSMHVSEKQKQVALNDKIEREWDTLRMYHNALGTDTEFYLPWGQTVSKRYTLITDLNYQESKLMREFMLAEGSDTRLNYKNKEQMEVFKAAVGQGLDLAPDKVSKETMIAEFGKRIDVVEGKGVEILEDIDPETGKDRNVALREAFETIRDGKFDMGKIAKVFHEAEGYHAISALEALAELDEAIKDGTYLPKTTLKLEVDAITSGMVLTLLQLGTDDAMRLAEKGGIYTKQRQADLDKYVKHWLGKDIEFTAGALIEAGKAHASAIETKKPTAEQKKLLAPKEYSKNLLDQKEEGVHDVFKDLYSSIGIAMVEEVKKTKADLIARGDEDKDAVRQVSLLNQIGDLNLKNVRSIAKSPVMVYIYGASIGSIKKKLAYSLGLDTLVKAIKTNAKAPTAELAEFIGQYTKGARYINVDGKAIDTSKMRPEEKLMYLDISSVAELMGKDINKTFGKGIEASFKSTFKEVDAMRDMTKSVELLTFETYKARLATEIDKALFNKYGAGYKDKMGRAKGQDKDYALSQVDLDTINQKLVEDGFAHNVVTYDQDGNRIEPQPLNKRDTRVGTLSTGLASLAIDQNTGKDTFDNSTATIKTGEEIANTGASSTIPIHAIDGNLMLETLSQAMNGDFVGENVYDAIILSIDKARLDAVADTYNAETVGQGFSRSILVDNFTKLESMLANSTTEEKRAIANTLSRKGGDANYKNDMQRLHLSMNKMAERLSWYKTANADRVRNSGGEIVSNHSHIAPAKPSAVKAGQAKTIGSTERIENLLEFVRDSDRVNGFDYTLDLSSAEKNANDESLIYWDKNAAGDSKWDFKRGSAKKLVAADRILIKGEGLDLETFEIAQALEAIKDSGAEVVIEGDVDPEVAKLAKAAPKSKKDIMKDKVAEIIKATENLPTEVRKQALAIIKKHKCN